MWIEPRAFKDSHSFDFRYVTVKCATDTEEPWRSFSFSGMQELNIEVPQIKAKKKKKKKEKKKTTTK